MKAQKPSRRNPKSEPLPIAKQISEQLNRMLIAKSGQGEVLEHNLEKGLGNEESLRDLVATFLPRRYGIAKGKVTNSEGVLSRHLDLIVYDALSCPTLFVDENRNQILPVEGVLAAFEVKTTLTASTLSKAFKTLSSVYSLAPRVDRSINDFITACPPYLGVFAFNDCRPLDTVAKQFVELNKKYSAESSFTSFSQKSPAFSRCTGDKYMVSSVDILNKGTVHHRYDGTPEWDHFGEYTIGMFLVGVLQNCEAVKMSPIYMSEYLNWIMVATWRGPDSALMLRQIFVGHALKALQSVHPKMEFSGFWHDADDYTMEIEGKVDNSVRRYRILLPHGLSPDEMERLAAAQITDADKSYEIDGMVKREPIPDGGGNSIDEG